MILYLTSKASLFFKNNSPNEFSTQLDRQIFGNNEVGLLQVIILNSNDLNYVGSCSIKYAESNIKLYIHIRNEQSTQSIINTINDQYERELIGVILKSEKSDELKIHEFKETSLYKDRPILSLNENKLSVLLSKSSSIQFHGSISNILGIFNSNQYFNNTNNILLKTFENIKPINYSTSNIINICTDIINHQSYSHSKLKILASLPVQNLTSKLISFEFSNPIYYKIHSNINTITISIQDYSENRKLFSNSTFVSVKLYIRQCPLEFPYLKVDHTKTDMDSEEYLENYSNGLCLL